MIRSRTTIINKKKIFTMHLNISLFKRRYLSMQKRKKMKKVLPRSIITHEYDVSLYLRQWHIVHYSALWPVAIKKGAESFFRTPIIKVRYRSRITSKKAPNRDINDPKKEYPSPPYKKETKL